MVALPSFPSSWTPSLPSPSVSLALNWDYWKKRSFDLSSQPCQRLHCLWHALYLSLSPLMFLFLFRGPLEPPQTAWSGSLYGINLSNSLPLLHKVKAGRLSPQFMTQFPPSKFINPATVHLHHPLTECLIPTSHIRSLRPGTAPRAGLKRI